METQSLPLRPIELALAALAGAAVLVASTGMAPALRTAEDHGDVHCEIREIQQGVMVKVQGVAWASIEITGEYMFDVVHAGDESRSITRQRGSFLLPAGRESEVASVVLGGDAASDYRATLVLAIGGATIPCSVGDQPKAILREFLPFPASVPTRV